MKHKKKYTRRQWKEWELEIIRHFYPTHDSKLIARLFKSTVSAVYNQANAMGLSKTPEYISYVTKRAWAEGKCNKMSCFAKGHVPVNKGKKMSPELYDKVKETMFKPGQLPANTKYDGAISVRGMNKPTGSEPYKYIRLSNAKWELLHRHLWKQANGPIPRGHVIAFKDGDWQNCTLENLECITREENMKRNSVHNYPPELFQITRVRAVLTRTINSITNSKMKQNG